MSRQHLLSDCIDLSAREREFFDHHPAICTDASGRTWVAWTSYAQRADAVMLRSVRDGEPEAILTLSTVRGAEGAPCIVPFEQGVFVAWPALREGSWRIYGRVAGADELGPEEVLSEGPADLQPALAVDAEDRLFLAWRALTEDCPHIMLRVHTDEGWGEALRVADGPGEQASISTEAMERLISHNWPGNVRELENTIKRAFAFSQGGRIMASDIMFITSDRTPPPRTNRIETDLGISGTLEDSLRKRIEATLYANDWNFTRTATKLGIGRTTLWRKIRKYNITKNNEALV